MNCVKELEFLRSLNAGVDTHLDSHINYERILSNNAPDIVERIEAYGEIDKFYHSEVYEQELDTPKRFRPRGSLL